MSDDDGVRADKMVKGMRQTVWERAKVHANRAGEPMSAYVERALTMLADWEDGAEVIPPGQQPPTPAPSPGVDTHALAELILAMVRLGEVEGRPAKDRTARGIPVAVRARAFAAGDLRLREACGQPPPKPRETVKQNGQTQKRLPGA